jgi:hypothetical protein
MRLRLKATFFVFVAITVLAGSATLVIALRSGSKGDVAAATTYQGFYLDIGASASLGMQPDGVVKHNGHRTNTGYANDLVAIEVSKGVALDLTQIGCPGETAQSMLSGADSCYTLPEDQLLRATTFLKENVNQPGIVTIDLGFNDVLACLVPPLVDENCAKQGIILVNQDMPLVLKALQSAAGPKVHFIGLEYSDPYLGRYLLPSNGKLDASESLQVFQQLNAVLNTVYAKAGIPVANVPGAYQIDDETPKLLKGFGTVPTNVAQACLLTWMCTGYPYGPDDHPNNAGYKLIAQTIAGIVPSTL